jgi:hypothetical protein
MEKLEAEQGDWVHRHRGLAVLLGTATWYGSGMIGSSIDSEPPDQLPPGAEKEYEEPPPVEDESVPIPGNLDKHFIIPKEDRYGDPSEANHPLN